MAGVSAPDAGGKGRGGDLGEDLGAEGGAGNVEQIPPEGRRIRAVVQGDALQPLLGGGARLPVPCACPPPSLPRI